MHVSTLYTFPDPYNHPRNSAFLSWFCMSEETGRCSNLRSQSWKMTEAGFKSQSVSPCPLKWAVWQWRLTCPRPLPAWVPVHIYHTGQVIWSQTWEKVMPLLPVKGILRVVTSTYGYPWWCSFSSRQQNSDSETETVWPSLHRGARDPERPTDQKAS